MNSERLKCGCTGECDDMGHYWRDVREAKQEKKRQNEKSSTEILKSKGVQFRSLNGGNHLQLENGTNFWPSTGKWIRKDGKKGRGVFNLIKGL